MSACAGVDRKTRIPLRVEIKTYILYLIKNRVDRDVLQLVECGSGREKIRLVK